MSAQDSYAVTTALDHQRMPRVFIKLLSGILGGATLALAIIARNDLEKATERVPLISPGTHLNDALKNSSQWFMTLAGVLAVHAFPMALYVLMRWHHPRKSSPRGKLSKFRITLMNLLSIQYFILSVVLVVITTYFIGIKKGKFVPEVSNPDELADRVGIKLHYIKEGKWVGILLLSWVMVVTHFIGAALEFGSLQRYKRISD